MAAGRGRLSSIDLLPPEAEEDVLWVYGELKKKRRTQVDILASFNTRLAVKAIPPISLSAFNRSAIRLNRMATRLEEARDIARVLGGRFEEGSDEQLTLLVGETIKMIVYETLEKIDNPKADGKAAEMIMNLAKALKSAEEAKRISADTRSKVEKEFEKKATEAVERVGRTRGLTEETKNTLKAELLGIRRDAAPPTSVPSVAAP